MHQPALGDPLEHHHRNLQGGGPRAAVFGMSDGLVTNVSLILGVVGAHPAGSVVRLAGLAGLVAGAFSMAAGEYVSMQAQRELIERELEIERRALQDSPEGEARELRGIYERRGIDPGLAREVVDEVMKDPDVALEVHARDELGINPAQLGMPLQAAAASFASFAIGAFLPLLPWLIGSGAAAVWASIIIAVTAAIAVGVILASLTGRSRWRGAIRQLGVAAIAAAVTFGIGRAVGVGVH